LGYFDEADVAVIINQVLGCINYCHNNGIAHRDLKPENILLADASMKMDDIKIIDFGLAAVFDNMEEARFSDKVGSCYYIAPEILDGDYGPKCDVWSCGVIAFILLSGEAPFDGEDDQEIVDAVYEGKFSFDNEIWDDISEEAKDFVEWLLTYDDNERPSAEEALKHPWLENTRRISCQGLQERRCKATANYLSNLEYFTADSKLKQAVCAFIASQLIMKHEKDVMDEVFRAMDTSCDGKLSRQELKDGFANFLGRHLSDEEVDDIFENVNYSCSGAIEYSEFIVASITLDESRLRSTFNEFDRSKQGVLTATDLKHALELGGGPDVEQYVDKIMRQIDTSNTGYISFEEFEAAMTPAPFVARRCSRRQSERSLGRRHRSRSRNIRRTSHIHLDDEDPATPTCSEPVDKQAMPKKLKSSDINGMLKSWRKAAAKKGPRKIQSTKSFSTPHGRSSGYARQPSRVLSRASIRSTH
jgi:calcium-dependent protein kinase